MRVYSESEHGIEAEGSSAKALKLESKGTPTKQIAVSKKAPCKSWIPEAACVEMGTNAYCPAKSQGDSCQLSSLLFLLLWPDFGQAPGSRSSESSLAWAAVAA